MKGVINMEEKQEAKKKVKRKRKPPKKVAIAGINIKATPDQFCGSFENLTDAVKWLEMFNAKKVRKVQIVVN